MNDLTPHKYHWCLFTDYYKYCDNLVMNGAAYAFVFNETKPHEYEKPYNFEQCVYIGKSAGNYYDKQNGSNGKQRSNIHKRMTTHHKPFSTGEGGESSHKAIVEIYGYGDNMLNGTTTNLPMWLCLILPPKDITPDLIERWCCHQEQEQLLMYQINWNKPTLGNMDTNKSERKVDSYSSVMMQSIEENSLAAKFPSVFS